MRYSEIKKLLELLHRYGYTKIAKIRIYHKMYALGHYRYMNQLSIYQILSHKGDLEELLGYLDRKADRKLINYI